MALTEAQRISTTKALMTKYGVSKLGRVSAPSSLAVSASAGQVAVTWTDSTDVNATTYVLQRSTDGVTYTTVHSGDKGDESWTDTTVADLTTYYYRLKATHGSITDLESTYITAGPVTTPSSKWTSTSPSSDTRIYFVSNSDGDDNNDGRDPHGFGISGGTYDHTGNANGERVLTASGAFTGYSLTSGSEYLDYIYITGATGGVTAGLYEIEEVVDADNIRLAAASGLTGDATSVTSSSGPFKTVAKGADTVRDTYPDWVLLKRGDTFSNQSVGNSSNQRWAVGGRSATEPMVVSTYGHPSTARPVVTGKDANHGIYVTENGKHVYFMGLDIDRQHRDPDHADYAWGFPSGTEVGIRILGVTNQTAQQTDILIEDCRFAHHFTGMQVQNISASTPHPSNIRLRYCQIEYDYASGDHRQGLYTNIADDITATGCVFYHCGWMGDDRDYADGIHVSFSGATYTHSDHKLTASGAFASYTWSSGDKIWLKTSTTGTVLGGRYEVASKVDDDSITLSACAGLTGDSSGDVSTGPPGATDYDHAVYFQDTMPASPNLTADANVTDVADNGSGKIRVTLDSATSYSVNDEVAMGGFTGNDDTGDGRYNGHFKVTAVISSTVYDLDRDWVVDSSPTSAVIGTSPQADNTDKFVIDSCYIFDCSGAGVQLRSGGTIKNTVVVNQAYPFLLGGPSSSYDNNQVFGVSGKITDNYAERMCDINSSKTTSHTIRLRNIKSAEVSGNVCISPQSGGTRSGIEISIAARPEHKNRGIVISNNRFYNHDKGCPNYTADTKTNTTIDTESGNYYSDAANGNDGGSTGWPVTGTNKNIESLSLVDNTRTVATYDAHVGGSGTTDSFIAAVRANRRGSWDASYDATSVISWIAAGYETT